MTTDEALQSMQRTLDALVLREASADITRKFMGRVDALTEEQWADFVREKVKRTLADLDRPIPADYGINRTTTDFEKIFRERVLTAIGDEVARQAKAWAESETGQRCLAEHVAQIALKKDRDYR